MRQSASAGEAAAIVAAVERFLAETTAGPAQTATATDHWQRAALLEGVNARKMTINDPEGGSRWQS
jgi:hypothetical protein